MSETFKIGDTVRLKSGGPLMTVTNVGTNNSTGQPTIWTTWFDDKSVEKNGHFPAGAVKVDDDTIHIA